MIPRRHFLFAGNGGQALFGFAKRQLVYLWERYLVHNWYIFGVADEKILQGECSAEIFTKTLQ